jgi:beta-N-acetylhexosaminidase
MEMRGLTNLYKGELHPEARAAVDAVKAGVDIVMVEGAVEPTFMALLNAVKSGEIQETRIDESLARIMTMKKRAKMSQLGQVNIAETTEVFARVQDWGFAQRVADSSVTLVRNNGFELPLRSHIGTASDDQGDKREKLTVISFTDSSQSPLGKAFKQELSKRRQDADFINVYYDRKGNPPLDSVLSAVKDSDRVVVAAFMTNLPGRRAELVGGRTAPVIGMNGHSAQLFSQILGVGGKKVLVVSLGSPYLILHYPIIQSYVCTFSTSSTSEIAAVKALFGEISNRARLPVTLPGIADRGIAIPWPSKH